MHLFDGTAVFNAIASSTSAYLPEIFPVVFLLAGLALAFFAAAQIIAFFVPGSIPPPQDDYWGRYPEQPEDE
jgi:hypothetical protein